jgi:hypothetical protein
VTQNGQLAPPPMPNMQAVQNTRGPSSPTSLYLATVRQRDELRTQVKQLEDTRSNLSNQLSEEGLSKVDKAGLENRLSLTDRQLTDAQTALAVANARVAQAAAVPGTNTSVGIPNGFNQRNNDMPKNVAIVSLMALAMMTAVLLPMSIAFARRMMGKTAPAKPTGMSPELEERLSRMEQAIDGVAIEMERVGEGQRFVTQLLADAPARSLAAGTGAADPLTVKARDAVR